MPNGKKKRKQYYKDFDLATFISEDRCVVCGNAKTLDNMPKEEPPVHYDPPPQFPIVSSNKEYFFVLCADCRQSIFDGLCISCTKEKEHVNQESDYVILNLVEHLSSEIIRYKSELTKWVPIIQSHMKLTAPITDDGKKNIKGLFGKKKKKK